MTQVNLLPSEVKQKQRTRRVTGLIVSGAVAVIAALADLRCGDLLYMPGHVLIHAGDGQVIHADGGTMTVRRDNLADWLRARGLVRAGYAADLALSDPPPVRAEPTFPEPPRHPPGIPYVIVNGQVVVDGPRYNAVPAGRVLTP